MTKKDPARQCSCCGKYFKPFPLSQLDLEIEDNQNLCKECLAILESEKIKSKDDFERIQDEW